MFMSTVLNRSLKNSRSFVPFSKAKYPLGTPTVLDRKGISILRSDHSISVHSISRSIGVARKFSTNLRGNLEPTIQRSSYWGLGALLCLIPCGYWFVSKGNAEDAKALDGLQLEDTKSLFEKKTTSELIFSLFILQLCSLSILNNYGPNILDFASKLHISAPIYFIIKRTFFKQFVAGQDLKETLQAVDNLYTRGGLMSILDFSVESGTGSKEELDDHTKLIKQTILESAKAPERLPFSCLKISGLTSHKLLERTSDLISYQEKNPTFSLPWKLDLASTPAANNPKVSSFNNPPLPLSQEEIQEFNDLVTRLDTLSKTAADVSVRLLIDAEQTYYQPVIDYLALLMSQKYNKKQAIIHNTYQMYLKDSYSRLKQDLELAQRQQFLFGVKLVRGAYMETENKRAVEKGYPSPIQPSIQDTHNNYNNGVKFLLDQINHSSVLVATHNEDSVSLTLNSMKQRNILPSDKRVFVGQLYGMCDHLSFGAAQKGLNVCKYVPFGPVEYVVPYLTRRVAENKGFIGRTQRERTLIKKEVKRRIFG